MKFIALLFLITSGLTLAKVKVATLSPLLTNLVEQIGGDRVEIAELVGKGVDPHTFSPTTQALKDATGAQLYLALGKGMEPYLPKLQSLVNNSSKIVEAGKLVHSLKLIDHTACCPHHAHHTTDPHWWHSPRAWRKVAYTVSKELSAIDPANARYYKANAKTFQKSMTSIYRWGKHQVAGIPKKQRIVSTSHAAFGYLCDDYGFKAIPLRGINPEQPITPQYLELCLKTIRENRVNVIFPDESSNNKALQQIADSAHIKLGAKLIADTHPDIAQMLMHNITVITQALQSSASQKTP